MSLRDVLNDPSRKNQLVADCLRVLDAEVSDKGGLSGIAVKTGFKVVKGFKPDFLEKVVADLLPDFADALEPIVEEATGRGEPVSRYLPQNASRVADALLAITDGKAARSSNRVVKGTYDKLRSTAKKHVESAVPRVAALIERYQ